MKSIRDEAVKAIDSLESQFHIECLTYQLPTGVSTDGEGINVSIPDGQSIDFTLKFSAVRSAE